MRFVIIGGRRSYLLAIFTGLIVAGTIGAFGQPPEVEDPKAKTSKKKIEVEDEDPKAKVKKKVQVEESEPKPKAAIPTEFTPTSPPDVSLEELIRAASEATNNNIKAILLRYRVPFDRLTDSKGQQVRMQPIPIFRGAKFPDEMGIAELDDKNQTKEVRNVGIKEVRKIDYFEELIIAEAEQLSKPSSGAEPTVTEKLAAAEKLLSAALRYHDYAREHGKRKLGPWEDLRRPLVEKLRTARIRQLQHAVTETDWPRARSVGTKMLAAYPKDQAIAKEVAVARVAEAEILMKTKNFVEQAKARELLDEFEIRFPGGGGEAASKIRKELSLEAGRLFDRARSYKETGNLVEARNELARAESLDPTVPGVRELKRELGTGYPVLYVGVRNFPEKMSPATARFDSERQAVQLLFEGLLEEVPDGSNGTRYRPGAALTMPAMLPSGREFLLRQMPRVANGIEGFDSSDVVETVKMLRARPELWPSAGLPWLDELPTTTAGNNVRIGFRYGHPEPRSLLTFKILPARWLTDRDKAVDDAEFAAKPFGTGPFRIHSITQPGLPGKREVAFTDNPLYGRWKDRINLPRLREIRFTELSRLKDPLDEFKNGRLHIVPDLTPDELKRAISQNGYEIGGKGIVVTAATNRRVHILAINHQRPVFQNKDLRKGLSLAIDREDILSEVFRVPSVEYRRLTAAMTGPFPPASWATVRGPAGQPIPLLNRDEASVRLRRYLTSPGAVPELKLSYPTGDPQAATACGRIKSQIESLFKDSADGRQLLITLEPLPPRELLNRVEQEHRFDLAYVPFEYPDDWYPFGLAAFLDPAAANRDGRNWTSFMMAGTNPDSEDRLLQGELAALRTHRDFSGDIAGRTSRIHKLFNDSVPFVPLWQIDRHTLFYSGLKIFVDDSNSPASPHLLNPSVLFNNTAKWRLE